jgi:hypothetical protein
MTFAVVIAIALLVCGPATAKRHKNFWNRGIEGSGDLESRQLAFESFDEIVLDGAADLYIRIGDRQEVEFTLDDNLFENLEAEVRGDALHLDWKENCHPSKGCRVDIVVPELRAMTINGAGDVEITDFQGEEFNYQLNGAGDLDIAGRVDELNIHLSGAGKIQARKLIAADVDVTVSGAGSATVTAEDRLEGVVSGVGNIVYYGDPVHERTRVTGIGKIKKR